jgi:hypothetical protein
MYFSLQESGDLLMSDAEPSEGLSFSISNLPADWYSELQADLEARKNPQPEAAAVTEVAPEVVTVAEEPKKAAAKKTAI